MATMNVLASCLLLASQAYSIPPAVLVGILKVEGGKVGQSVGPNKNGTYDLGPMQINTSWLPKLADIWGVSEETARQWVRDDPCTNVGVAAWILRTHYDETGSMATAIGNYHSRTPRFSYPYKAKVYAALYGNGLVVSPEQDKKTVP